MRTIPPWRGFVDDLAWGLLQQLPNPLALARAHILVPNRRSASAVADAFLRHADGRALLLPRISVLGDLEAEDLVGGFAADLDADARPEIAPFARRLLLARLLSKEYRAPQALALGQQLGAALDMLFSEGKRARDLDEAVPDAALQEHWLKNRKVLGVAVEMLPNILAERGLADPILDTNRLLGRLARRWEAQPPDSPVVMAGVAHAPPAVAGLARVVARLPGGCVVLPGFQPELSDAVRALVLGTGEEWPDAPLESHPMHGMLTLLGRMGVAPAEVRPWAWEAPVAGSSPARAAIVWQAMAPAALALAGARQPEEAVGLRMVETAGPAEEATVIAIALRQVVETPGRTALLVTPDRKLARRVQVRLGRFGIAIDDSAGTPLAACPPGSLLVALAAAAGEDFAPVALLSLLMHPLVRAGDARLAWLDKVRALDKALRGLRPPPGLPGVATRLTGNKALAGWWAGEVVPILGVLSSAPADAARFFEVLVATAETLAGKELWQREAGQALATLAEAVDAARADLAPLRLGPADYESFVRQLLAGVTVRPRWRQHPQLQILGPLEARLQRADLVILGGLNEGIWPARPTPDPFLAPVIRRVLGLPHLAQRIGLQAHDLVMALGAPEVLMTRAARDGPAPSIPSRFWSRLEAAAGGLPDSGAFLPDAATLLRAARDIDRPFVARKWKRPAPVPPRAARPTRLSVTEVARLKADPFAFYARRVLGLEPLEPLDSPLTAADRGTLVHTILQKIFAGEADVDALIRKALGDGPEIYALWRPRLLRMVADARRLDAAEGGRIVGLEKKGALARHGVTLVGRADRIERDGNGLRIIDYKTGTPPNMKDVKALRETQLALLAAMAEHGAFPGIAADKVAALSYWKISGTTKPGKVQPAIGRKATPAEVQAHIAETLADFDDLIGKYLLGRAPFEARAGMAFAGAFSDYDQLSRVVEWLNR